MSGELSMRLSQRRPRLQSLKVGPHGLMQVDVYEPQNGRQYRTPFDLSLANKEVTDAMLLCINDTYGTRVADALFDVVTGDRDAAVQWLIDFCYLTADGR